MHGRELLRRWLEFWQIARIRRFVEGCSASLCVHAALCLILALVYHSERIVPRSTLWIAVAEDFTAEPAELFVAAPLADLLDESTLDAEAPADSAQPPELDPLEIALPAPAQAPVASAAEAAETPASAPTGEAGEPDAANSAPTANGFSEQGGYAGRSGPSRQALVRRFGGTPESEQAVDMALAWLAAHQRRDGSWRFTFDEACGGRCRDPGTVGTTTGATALALLPFLGAGHLPEEGPYGEVVQNGLYYLRGRMLKTSRGGDLQEGTMYAQGLAALALCEAYAMSKQEPLRAAAQSSVDFIANVQHPAGGWRYYPGQPGDTTVTGWQLMALKSAHLGGLHVPSPVIERARHYLNTVQQNQGAYYGYALPAKEPGPTAVGLLCRMYMGWKQDDPRLQAGVAYLAKIGPSRNDMYFNYYASQVLRHYGGAEWPKFNERLREHLLASQARSDHERGSWHFAEKHGSVGGRLYTTALCAMILEVYYRHLPIYDAPAVENGF